MLKLKRKNKVLLPFSENSVKTEVKETKEVGESLVLPTRSHGISFGDIVQRAHDIERCCEDSIILPEQVRESFISTDGKKVFYNFESESKLRFTDYSFGQMCNKLGVPVGYMQKCLSDEKMRELVDYNLNSWLSEYSGGSMLVRKYNDSIRGVLSNKYSICDTGEILNTLGEVLPVDDFNIKGYFISPERFHMRCVMSPLNIPGEDLFAGIQVDSSDVGRSTLIVSFLIYKQVCTNGLVISRGGGTLFKQKHIGVKSEVFGRELKESYAEIPSLIKWAKMSIEEAMQRGEVDFDTMTQDKMNDLINKVKTLTSFDDKLSMRTIEIMRDKYTPNTWGLVNALTEVAQEFTLERRLEIEKIAGGLLIAA